MRPSFLLPVPRLPYRPGSEFPSPLYAADERADHGEIAAQHLARGCVSPQVIRHAHVVQPGVKTEAVALPG